jgi:hypothetical protein
MKKFELPTNDDFESILKKNLDHTKPLEMKQKEVNGTKSLFPFWTPVANGGADVFYDPEDYLSKKDKELRKLKDNTGAVEPKSEFKTTKNGTIDVKDSYEDYTIIGKMQKLIGKINGDELDDKVGVVKPKTEDMPSKKTKPETTFDNKVEKVETTSHAASPKGDKDAIVKPKTEDMPSKKTAQVTKQDNVKINPVETKSHAASPKGDKVGIVKPKTEDMPEKKTTPVTKQDGTVNPVETKSHAASPKGDKVGIVKPKTEDKVAKASKPKESSEIDATKPDLKVTSNAAKPKGDNVGVVKVKSDIKPDPKGISFDKYM